jgi:hypothetical protein
MRGGRLLSRCRAQRIQRCKPSGLVKADLCQFLTTSATMWLLKLGIRLLRRVHAASDQLPPPIIKWSLPAKSQFT